MGDVKKLSGPSLALASTLVALLVSSTGAPAGAEPAAAPLARKAASVSLIGNGFGHGHGMSQYGAQGAATKGLNYRRILSFYYPGLRAGQAGGSVSVLLSADTTSDVIVSARNGLKAVALGKRKTVQLNRKGARLWRITPANRGRRSAIGYKAARGGWKTLRTVPGDAQFTARGKPIVLHTPSGNRSYRGTLRSASPSASGSTNRDTVNVLPLDSYLKGVVPREVPAAWKPAALQAQAVAARTYAAFEKRQPLARHYQICDTSSCQVYGGYTDEHPATNAAIAATSKQILTSGSGPAFTQFSASNGGWMSAASQPYLVAKKDPYDQAYRGWRDSVSGSEIERAFPAIGSFRSVAVTDRDGHGRWGGRVLAIKITGTSTSTTVSGETFRSYFGLKSSWFDVR